MTWQKQVRALLGVLVLLLIGGVAWYATRQRVAPVAAADSPRIDQNCETEISGNTQERHDEAGRLVFRLKYDYGCINPADGTVRLVNLTGTTARGSRPVEFKSDDAIVKVKPGAGADVAQFDEIRMRGNVLVKSGKELYFETSEATYNDVTGVMETAKPVKIKRGKMSGSGTGATFDRERSVVWLLANANVSIATDGQGTLRVASARAGLAELDHYMRFDEHVRMERDGRVIETDAAVANLTPEGTGITSLELRGNSRITGAPAGGGGVPNMQADDITITYGAETGLLERSVLMRAARLDLPEGGGRSLTAGYIDIGFGGDGSTVTVLDANEAVALKIPAEKDLPSRDVRAARLEARGAVPKGLEQATFTGAVEFHEQLPARGGKPALDRIAKSGSMVLGLDGGFDSLKDADFSGGARFRDGDIYGEAPTAKYGVDKKHIALRGGAATARVEQDNGTIEAKEIDLTLEPRKIAARAEAADTRDRVKSTLKPGARKERKEPRPSLLDDDQPIYVTSRKLDYDGTTERATYVGDARLSQGDTVIQGETIVLDDKTGNLEARKKADASAVQVRTLFIIREDPAPGQKPAGPTKPTQGNGDELIYDESRRQATFRGNARLAGPDGIIRADRIELFLQEDGNTLDRAEGYDKVTAHLEGNRVATGDRLTYNAKTRHYDMRGAPLKVREERVEKGQKRCDETVGSSLTFDRSADKFKVVGADGAPSRTVPVPCTAK